jgi:DeoR family transcriptional regulator, suf operon transcriptional repressor
MLPVAPTLPGFRGIRGDVLVAVKKAQPVTATELGAQFGLTANALRRHLKELESEGLVRCGRQVRGVGGPVLLYSLTEQGEALFPRAYDATLTTLLDGVRSQRGTDGVVELFRAQWERVAGGAKEQLAALPLNERAQLLAELLTSHGYMAEAGASADASETLIREHNCVLRAVAEKFPEVCVAEERFLAEFLGAVVERRQHIASGASCCEYCVRDAGIGNRESGIATPRLNDQHVTTAAANE